MDVTKIIEFVEQSTESKYVRSSFAGEGILITFHGMDVAYLPAIRKQFGCFAKLKPLGSSWMLFVAEN
jgi:antitoxin (DNA-binding transcriptional repressor) of toxin-antitoxin stability system